MGELPIDYQDEVLRLADLQLGERFTYLGKTFTRIKHYHYNATDGVDLFELPLYISVEEIK